jgi:hypothetical protein
MPGLLPVVKARVARRRARPPPPPAARPERHALPVGPSTQRRHTPTPLAPPREAKAASIAAEAVPETFAGKRLQDTRDTCITRLQEAGVAIARMWTWTGHSQDGIEEILRDHYLVLRAEGQPRWPPSSRPGPARKRSTRPGLVPAAPYGTRPARRRPVSSRTRSS